jgi:hypothetical protein
VAPVTRTVRPLLPGSLFSALFPASRAGVLLLFPVWSLVCSLTRVS